jgi:hypothetical protein
MFRKARQKCRQKLIAEVSLANSKVNPANIKVNGANVQSRPAGFCLHWQTASCILSASKYFQYLKTLALAGGEKCSEVAFFKLKTKS